MTPPFCSTDYAFIIDNTHTIYWKEKNKTRKGWAQSVCYSLLFVCINQYLNVWDCDQALSLIVSSPSQKGYGSEWTVSACMIMKIFITTKRNLKKHVSTHTHFQCTTLLLWVFCFRFFFLNKVIDSWCTFVGTFAAYSPSAHALLPTLSISGTMHMVSGPTLDHHLSIIIWVEDHFSYTTDGDMVMT